MSEVAKKSVTYQDVLDAPPGVVAEIIDGNLSLQPRPAPAHAETCFQVAGSLTSLGGRGGETSRWRLLYEPQCQLGDNVLVPDIAGWRVDRMPKTPRQAVITLPPDWVCEILSPSTVKMDRTSKMRIYNKYRVSHVWLVDPLNRLLEVYQLAGDFWQRILAVTGDERLHIPPFEVLEIDLARWWVDLEEDTDG